MSIAFSPSYADFTNIDVRGGLFISEVQHKTFVQVDEEGTEAAAVTSVGVGRTSIGDNFVMRVDRPFLFVIRENNTGTILFIGKIVQPKF
jgi:serpin B